MSDSSNPDEPTVTSSPYAAAERAKKARIAGDGASAVSREGEGGASSKRPSISFTPKAAALVTSFCAAVALGAAGIIAAVVYEKGPCAAQCPDGNCGTVDLDVCNGDALVAPSSIPGIVVMLGLAAVVVGGWPEAARIRNPRLARGVLSLVAAASALAASAGYESLAFVAAGSIFLCFMAEMLRKDGRENLLGSVSATFLGSILIVASGFWPLLLRNYEAGAVVLAGMCLLIGGLGRYASASDASSSPARLIARSFFYSFAGGAIYLYVTGLGFETRSFAWLAAMALAFGATSGLADGAARSRVAPTKAGAAALAVVPHCALGVIVYALSFAVS
ncbi:hypothetical protein A4H34_00715 [Peptidiphaga gingivicola]|uniref:Uncharacterized protein n=1 Tax=Peptidiphaga gingivicola TaxID=2741497 RepID=A0A179B2Y9_9ACTO|nr:hypothetical protein [Peptidiphaga gingivicola]OAP85755.1 hypothetical protein A4H34_00715 [Peptidiphaga gingivicola]